MQSRKDMNFKEAIILAYFKMRNGQYSYEELSRETGLSSSEVARIMMDLLSEGFLKISNGMIELSFKGRIRLQESNMEFFEFEDNNSVDEYKRNAVSIDEVYLPINFKL